MKPRPLLMVVLTVGLLGCTGYVGQDGHLYPEACSGPALWAETPDGAVPRIKVTIVPTPPKVLKAIVGRAAPDYIYEDGVVFGWADLETRTIFIDKTTDGGFLTTAIHHELCHIKVGSWHGGSDSEPLDVPQLMQEFNLDSVSFPGPPAQ